MADYANVTNMYRARERTLSDVIRETSIEYYYRHLQEGSQKEISGGFGCMKDYI